jgi:CarD family transcriptional regulator
MFCVNEYVVYGSEGVCRIESIGRTDITGLDKEKEYYTLVPVYKSGKIYTPTDSTIIMRRVITKERAQELVKHIKDISSELDVPRDAKLAAAFYKELVRTYECEKLIKVIRHIFEKQRELIPLKKNLPAVDSKYFKMAQDILYGELGFALGIAPNEVKGYIEKNCG